jgi:hypothetical protein
VNPWIGSSASCRCALSSDLFARFPILPFLVSTSLFSLCSLTAGSGWGVRLVLLGAAPACAAAAVAASRWWLCRWACRTGPRRHRRPPRRKTRRACCRSNDAAPTCRSAVATPGRYVIFGSLFTFDCIFQISI